MIDAYAKDIEKNKIDCNNINLNLNGLDTDAVPEPLSSLLQAQAETEGAQMVLVHLITEMTDLVMIKISRLFV